MPISVQTIISQVESALDAEGFDRYQFDEDFKPAINYAKDWLVSAFNRVFDENKLSPEILRELIRFRVFITSTYSRIAINPTQTQDELWSIVAVYPKIEYDGILINTNTLPKGHSALCPQASYIKSYHSAKRLTFEQVNNNRKNPFVAGNEIDDCEDTMQYAYVAFADYKGAYSPTPVWEIEVTPSVPLQPVAVGYVAYPKSIATVNDTLPFPASLTNMLVNQTLDFISYKQGDNTNLKGVTDQDLMLLMQLMK